MDPAAPGSTPGSCAPSPPFFRPGAETPLFDEGFAPGGAATSEGWLRRDAMPEALFSQQLERLQLDISDRLGRIEEQAAAFHRQNLEQHQCTQAMTSQVIDGQRQELEARQVTAAVLKELGPMMEQMQAYV